MNIDFQSLAERLEVLALHNNTLLVLAPHTNASKLHCVISYE